MTLYERLGVSPQASAGEVRDAYRRLARQHHPDRGGLDPAAMAALNEAYRVLRDPARRAVYDQSLRTPVGSAAGGPAPVPPRHTDRPTSRPTEPLPPARYPWKLVVVMFLLGTAVVLLGVALYEPAAEPPPDNLLGPGSCVFIEDNGDAREINCRDGTEELVVEVLVPSDAPCPMGTTGYRDRQGRGLACVRAPS